VHREQLEDYPNKMLFEKENEMQLAKILGTLEVHIKPYNYEEKVLAFSLEFINLSL
jgi:hypothetical protein